jgi:hypothetical protein
MSRLDWKRGRFSADQETDRVYKAMRGWRDTSGDWLDYYRFDYASTVLDTVYDEAVGQGRIYKPRVRVPVLHVTVIYGENQNTDMGFYFNNGLHIICAFDQFTGVGMDYADIQNGNYLKDRIYYKQNVYRTIQMEPSGQIQERPTMVSIDATQLKPDELVDDKIFAQWSQT